MKKKYIFFLFFIFFSKNIFTMEGCTTIKIGDSVKNRLDSLDHLGLKLSEFFINEIILILDKYKVKNIQDIAFDSKEKTHLVILADENKIIIIKLRVSFSHGTLPHCSLYKAKTNKDNLLGISDFSINDNAQLFVMCYKDGSIDVYNPRYVIKVNLGCDFPKFCKYASLCGSFLVLCDIDNYVYIYDISIDKKSYSPLVSKFELEEKIVKIFSCNDTFNLLTEDGIIKRFSIIDNEDGKRFVVAIGNIDFKNSFNKGNVFSKKKFNKSDLLGFSIDSKSPNP